MIFKQHLQRKKKDNLNIKKIEIYIKRKRKKIQISFQRKLANFFGINFFRKSQPTF